MAKEVLIVEHDKDVAFIKEYFSRKNIECKEISYLKGAQKLVLEDPDRWMVIILDIKFPVDLEGEAISGTGIVFLEKLKENKMEIPVLINSRQLVSEDVRKRFSFLIDGQLVGHEFFDAGRIQKIFKDIEPIKNEEQEQSYL